MLLLPKAILYLQSKLFFFLSKDYYLPRDSIFGCVCELK